MMDNTPYSSYGQQQPSEERSASALLRMIALIAAMGAFVGVLFLFMSNLGEGDETTAISAGTVSRLDYPASLETEMKQPANGQWVLPSDVAVAGGWTFVLDTENGRILKLDDSGSIIAVLDNASDERLALLGAMAIDSDGRRLFVANSGAGEVLVMDLSGQVEKAISLQPIAAGDRAPRPIGVAVTPDGGIVVSDADNHRVVRLDDEGRVMWSAGTGTRAGGSKGFNVPAALALDRAGNIYVVDTLNGRVTMLSSDGAFLGQFGQRGRTAGTLSRPKGVTVDREGHVFVSDGMQAAVEVFDQDRTYLGVIGRRDPTNPGAGSLFQVPAGLWISDDKLYVMDRIGGLITLQLSGPSSAEAPAGGEEEG